MGRRSVTLFVPPPRVIRYDGDDPYLVVAADKGTASFSNLANGIALAHGFWLGDAFASGGSNGYDHKVVGITARGGWVLVKRMFRERVKSTSADSLAHSATAPRCSAPDPCARIAPDPAGVLH